MITAESIERIRSVAPSDVISKFVNIKKKGANWSGCCPFHDEKTPSFSVNDVRGFYKCFGCGQSGDVIEFVIQHEKKSFYDACLTVAELAGISIEIEQREYSEKEKLDITAAELQEQVINFSIPIFQKELQKLDQDHPARRWLQERNINDDVIAKWQIGWSPDEWKFLTPQLINKNWFEPSEKIGLIKRKNDNNFDGYRSRIIIPIRDRSGRNIGLGGRYIRVNKNDAVDIPKYLNPGSSEIYNKSVVLFGLAEAAAGIKKYGYAIVTEGYLDVIVPHAYGWPQVIATCGTAFTTQQMKLLKKHTSHVIMMRDNDTAGRESFNKSLPDLLREGFRVDIMLYDGKDPDEYIRTLDTYNNSKPPALPTIADGFIHRVYEAWRKIEDPHERASTKKTILELLAIIPNEILRNNYLDTIAKELKWKASETKKEFASIAETFSTEDPFEEETSAIKFAAWMTEEQKEECLDRGYVAVNRKQNGKPMVGYYSFGSNGKTEITNFVIKPLFHVYAGVESRYLVQIYNGYRHAVLDVPARVIPSVDQFQSFTVSEGNFLVFGSKPQWLRIASELLQTFPRCMEIMSLGWQNHDFFCWVDKIFVPGQGLVNMDDWGIFNYKDENFLIPASCQAYKQLQRSGDDPYENDRYLTFKESPINFSAWANLMSKVYKQKGPVGIAYAVLSVFRDIIFEVDNNCPHLYGFGEPSSGKSKWAESITAIFYYKRSAYNLNSGTDFAFFNYMQRYRNCPAHLNEFDIEVIKQEWFQAIKGVFDGEGRERGKQNGPKNRTEVMRVRSTLILTGQKLVTADDNSVVTRSIIEPFSTEEYSEEQQQDYVQLKTHEARGMSSILIEVLQHRAHFEKHYKENFNTRLSDWRKSKKDSRQLNQRILQNFSHLATCYEIIAGFISLPQEVDEFTEYCYNQAVKWSHFIRSSDTLSEFWRTLEFFVNQRDVEESWDYIVEQVTSVTIRINRNESREVKFDVPTKVLYLRLNNVHKLYQSAYRMRTGKEGMNMENLLHYFTSRKYYVGNIKQKRFRRFNTVTENVTTTYGQVEPKEVPVTAKKEEEKITSCYAFIYEDLEIDISSLDGKSNQEEPVVNDLPF